MSRELLLKGTSLCIGIVQSRFNSLITEGLKDACIKELEQLGIQKNDILHVTVPGALEIPIALQQMATLTDCDVLIALGAVIRGETYHFELVSNESAAGIRAVSLNLNIPIVNAVLTTENEAQAQARIEEKGRDAARAAVEMACLLEAIEELSEAREDL